MSDIEELARLLDMPGDDLDWGGDGEPFCFLEYEQTGEMSAGAASALEAGAALELTLGQQQQSPAPAPTTRPRL